MPGKHYSTYNHINIKTMLCIFSLLFFGLVFAAPAIAQSTETWKLVKREYTVLPYVITDVKTGRNAGTFIEIRPTQKRNEVVYIHKEVVQGQTTCHWISGFVWSDNLPEVINTGKEYRISLESKFVRRHGQGCGMGRISVTFGSQTEPRRDRSANVIHVKPGLADPDPGGIAPQLSTEVFRVDARPDLPNNKIFTVAIHISDGGVTDKVVALYVYQKAVR